MGTVFSRLPNLFFKYFKHFWIAFEKDLTSLSTEFYRASILGKTKENLIVSFRKFKNSKDQKVESNESGIEVANYFAHKFLKW